MVGSRSGARQEGDESPYGLATVSRKSKKNEKRTRLEWVMEGLKVLGVLAGIAGLVISLIALKEAQHANDEQAEVKFNAVASVNNLGSTPAGYAVRITLNNASLRPIIIERMELKVDGVPVAPITGVLPGNRSAAATLGDEPLYAAKPLPFALAERGAETLTGLADFFAADHAKSRSAELGAAEEFCDELPSEPTRVGAPQVRRARSNVALEIDYAPGGVTIVPVQITATGAVENTWRMEVLASEGTADGVAFWRYDSAPSALRLLTLKVWRGDGGLMRTVSLPVTGSVTSEALFKPLPEGYYRAALIDEGQPVAVGHFDVPLESDQPIYPQWQQLVNGQCHLLRQGKNVFSYSRKGFEGPNGWAAELRAAGLGS
jgi:hypothetical protein